MRLFEPVFVFFEILVPVVSVLLHRPGRQGDVRGNFRQDQRELYVADLRAGFGKMSSYRLGQIGLCFAVSPFPIALVASSTHNTTQAALIIVHNTRVHATRKVN